MIKKRCDKNSNFTITISMLHDTHTHIEMLLNKLDIIPSVKESMLARDIEHISSLPKPSSNRLDELLAGHEFCLQSTVSTGNFQIVTKLLSGRTKIKYFLGSHPEIVQKEFDLSIYLSNQREFLNSHPEILTKNYDSGSGRVEVVGIGEVGLDKHYTQDAELIKTQIELFRSQIELAVELSLPLMVHCRDAFDQLLPILAEYPKIHNHFLIHCFTGNSSDLQGILKLGGIVAFGGVVTFNSAKELQQACVTCPNESFVLETDLPFLSPVRGQVCIPEHIDYVAKKVATLKNLSQQKIWELSRSNVTRLFGI